MTYQNNFQSTKSINISSYLELIKKVIFFLLSFFLTTLLSQNKYNIKEIIEKNENWYHLLNNTTIDGRVYKKVGDSKYFMGKIEDGKKSGVWTAWYPNGRKSKEEVWEDGLKLNGFLTCFSKNGIKTFQKEINTNTGDGQIIHWYENGQIMREEEWRKHKLIKEITWYKNGQKEKELIWNLKNYKTFSQKFWHKNNQKTKEMILKNSKMIQKSCWNFRCKVIPCD